MSLVPVDLDNPANLNHRWASLAAVAAARGWADNIFAEGVMRHYDDGGGNWARMALLPGGRAVLFGNDHEYSETYWREAAGYFGEEETDLVAGAPAWWEETVSAHRGDEGWVGFIYGWEDGRWLRAEYAVDDGFTSVGLSTVSHEATVAELASALSDGSPTPSAIEALVQAGPGINADQLAAVIPPHWDVDAGVAAARACRLPE